MAHCASGSRFIIHGTRDEIVPVWHGQALSSSRFLNAHVGQKHCLLQVLHQTCVKKGIAYDAYVVEDPAHLAPGRILYVIIVQLHLQGADHNNLEMQAVSPHRVCYTRLLVKTNGIPSWGR